MVLNEFLAAIKDEGLTLRPSKCSFRRRKEYNVSDVRKFLGITIFFCKFVQHYGQIVSPLTRLLKKDPSPFLLHLVRTKSTRYTRIHVQLYYRAFCYRQKARNYTQSSIIVEVVQMLRIHTPVMNLKYLS